jgi:hypothetical protein
VSDKAIHGNRALRVTPRGQRAIGQPVTVQVTVELDAVRAVLDAADDHLNEYRSTLASPALAGDVPPGVARARDEIKLYVFTLTPAVDGVRRVVERAAADAGSDVRSIR